MIDLDELERLERAATPAPWVNDRYEIPYAIGPSGKKTQLFCDYEYGPNQDEDPELFIAARNALPELIKAARERDELKEENRAHKKLIAKSFIHGKHVGHYMDTIYGKGTSVEWKEPVLEDSDDT